MKFFKTIFLELYLNYNLRTGAVSLLKSYGKFKKNSLKNCQKLLKKDRNLDSRHVEIFWQAQQYYILISCISNLGYFLSHIIQCSCS